MSENKRESYPDHRKHQHVQMKELIGKIERELNHLNNTDLPKKIIRSYLKDVKEWFDELALRLD